MASGQGVRKTVTVLFSDVTGSTALGEQLDAEVTRRVLARYFDEARAVIERHGGEVEKFIGDAVMGVFGVPTAHEDDALRGVRAAVEMRDAVDRLNELGGPVLEVRTGLNTGEVVAGAGEVLVTGDAVNIAARLEQTAAPGEILIGTTTHELVRDAVEADPIELLELRGKAQPVAAWRLRRVIEGAPALARRLDAPLVGRRGELERLVAEFEDARDEQACRLITIVGEAGIGKSRLSRELVSAVGDEATCLAGRCLPYGDGITYWPLVEIVRQAAPNGIAQLLAGRDDATWIGERVAAVVGESELPTVADEIVVAVRRLVEHIGRRRPLVVEIDDIQWAEARFLELIETVTLLSRDAPVLLVCLARPELLERRPDWPGPIVQLGPLTPAESAELMADLGTEPVGDEARGRIADTAGGNPLFIEQLVAMAAQDGNGSRLAVPPSIDALLTARLDRLDRGERDAIERASVVGYEFWAGAIRRLSPEGTEIGSPLLGLARKHLIRPHRSSFPDEDAFRFEHILIRDAAYHGMPKELRADLHMRFAEWVEAKEAERASRQDEIVGYHLRRAYLYRSELGLLDEGSAALAERAVDRLAGASERALARGDLPAVASLLSHARALVPEGDRRRAVLAKDLVPALAQVGNVAGAEAVAEEANEIANGLDDVRLRAHVRLGVLSLRLAGPNADLASTRRELNELLTVFEEAEDEVGLARTWSRVSDCDWLESRAASAEEAVGRSLAHARRAGDRWREMDALNSIATILSHGPTPVEEAIGRCEGLLGQAEGAPLVEAGLLRALGRLHAMQGDFERARDEMSRGVQTLEDFGLRVHAESARGQGMAFVDAKAGDVTAAERALRESYQALEEMGETSFLSTVAAVYGLLLVEVGRLDEAAGMAEASRRNAAPEDAASQVAWRSVRARLLARGGETEEAERVVREAVALADRTDFLNLRADTMSCLAEVLWLGGRSREAGSALRRAIDIYEAKGNLVDAGRLRALAKEFDVRVR
jgi:class 3 adenylate cyclase/predicted ATPase